MNDAGDVNQPRERLRELGALVVERGRHRKDLRSTQHELVAEALSHRATVAEVAEAGGLSRAYLHRIGAHTYRQTGGAGPSAGTRSRSLDQLREIRDDIQRLDSQMADVLIERDTLILQLSTHVNKRELAADAQVSQEWIRRIVTRPQPPTGSGGKMDA